MNDWPWYRLRDEEAERKNIARIHEEVQQARARPQYTLPREEMRLWPEECDEVTFFNRAITRLSTRYQEAVSAREYPTDYALRSRAEEERWLRAPQQHERPCRSDDNCEGMRLTGTAPIVLVEFYNQGALLDHAKTGAWPRERAYCVLCRRRQGWTHYYNTMCATYSPPESEDDEGQLADRFEEMFLDQDVPSTEAA